MRPSKRKKPLTPAPSDPLASLTDEELSAEYQRRFQARATRVLKVMKKERITWGVRYFIGKDGRPSAEPIPLEMAQ